MSRSRARAARTFLYPLPTGRLPNADSLAHTRMIPAIGSTADRCSTCGRHKCRKLRTKSRTHHPTEESGYLKFFLINEPNAHFCTSGQRGLI